MKRSTDSLLRYAPLAARVLLSDAATSARRGQLLASRATRPAEASMHHIGVLPASPRDGWLKTLLAGLAFALAAASAPADGACCGRLDFNGDGRSDLIWVTNPYASDTQITAVWLMDGLTPIASRILFSDLWDPAAWWPTYHGDLNGDGKSDLIWYQSAGGESGGDWPSVAAWLMDGMAVTSSAVLSRAGWFRDPRRPADLNGDGKADLLFSSSDYSGHQGKEALLMNGLAVLDAKVLTADPAWDVWLVGDFNADGKDDLVWRNWDTGQWAIWLMDGLVASSSAIIFGDRDWEATQVGDFDGDGRADLAWHNAKLGQTAIWLMNGLATTAAAVIYTHPHWRVTHTDDFNGDGSEDLVWHNEDTGEKALWLMNGLATSGAAVIYADPSWRVTYTGDFNGDGKADLVWYNYGAGQTAIWLMDGLVATSSTVFSYWDWFVAMGAY